MKNVGPGFTFKSHGRTTNGLKCRSRCSNELRIPPALTQTMSNGTYLARRWCAKRGIQPTHLLLQCAMLLRDLDSLGMSAEIYLESAIVGAWAGVLFGFDTSFIGTCSL
jgi:hypothetical protein